MSTSVGSFGNVYDPQRGRARRLSRAEMGQYARQELASSRMDESSRSLTTTNEELGGNAGGNDGGSATSPYSSPYRRGGRPPAVVLQHSQRPTVVLENELPSFLDNRSEVTDETSDPNKLYSILEDAIPKHQHQKQARNDGSNFNLTAMSSSNNVSMKQMTGGKQKKTSRDILELTWEGIRRWLWSHPSFEVRQSAAYVRGQNDATPLHLMCKLYNPPVDILQTLIEVAPDTVSWTDTHGWLPLHHACANGASPEVLKLLIEAFPAGKIQPDHQKRTPLHFYATRSTDNPSNMALNAELLSDTGAAEMVDNGGMLPMHYACAYGTHPAVLAVLAAAHPPSLTATEHHGRTLMHLAMVNAHRDASPGVIQFLLQHEASKRTINARDHDGYLPLHLMALGLKGYRADDHEKRMHISDCLEMYLAAEPVATADFLTAIQDLPDWLQDTAVVSKHVRNILNEKIVQRFPTFILMMDGMMLMLLVICFAFTTKNHIELRLRTYDEGEEQKTNETKHFLRLLFVGASYFFTREFAQVVSLLSLGSLPKWFRDPTNWLDMTVIVLVFYYGIKMLDDTNDSARHLDDFNDSFRTGVSLTQGILWVAVIVYLKSTLVDFAVFVGGLFNVVQRLVAFMLAACVILLAFAQMFYLVYLKTPICEASNITMSNASVFETSKQNITYEQNFTYMETDLGNCTFRYCSFENSLLSVYTMMMGEVNNVSRYYTNETAQVLYIWYAFLVIILLSNVLIAIVTDSYEIIQNDRAAIVFWSNRLDFVAEMDGIAYAVQRRLGFGARKNPAAGSGAFIHGDRDSPKAPAASASSPNGTDTDQDNNNNNNNNANRGAGGGASISPHGGGGGGSGEESESPDASSPNRTHYFRKGWRKVMTLFDEDLFDDVDLVEKCVYFLFQFFCILIVIPLWLLLGFVTAGLLWPPQVREYLFVQRETVKSRSELERKKLEKLKAIQTDLRGMKQDLLREMANDREEMSRMKTEVDAIQSEVLAELMQVRELMTSLVM